MKYIFLIVVLSAVFVSGQETLSVSQLDDMSFPWGEPFLLYANKTVTFTDAAKSTEIICTAGCDDITVDSIVCTFDRTGFQITLDGTDYTVEGYISDLICEPYVDISDKFTFSYQPIRVEIISSKKIILLAVNYTLNAK